MDIYPLSKRRDDLLLLMRYAVPQDHTEEAKALLDLYGADVTALNLLREFYSYLPEAEDDAIRQLRLVARKKGVCLLCAVTVGNAYLYVSSADGADFLGNTEAGIWDQEVLDFFDLRDREVFLKMIRQTELLPVYVPAYKHQDLCPVCGVIAGELHVLGCPVETCPWCGGQLTRCNCRFAQLQTTRINQEGQIEAFNTKLEAAGRIPFDPQRERPAFPADPKTK